MEKPKERRKEKHNHEDGKRRNETERDGERQTETNRDKPPGLHTAGTEKEP